MVMSVPGRVSFSRHSVVVVAYMEKTQCDVCYIYKMEIAVDNQGWCLPIIKEPSHPKVSPVLRYNLH